MADLKTQFSADEIHRLQTEWKIIHDKCLTEVGVKLLLKIFNYEPMVQYAFPPLRDMSPTTLSSNPVFRAHAARFMLVTDRTIRKLDTVQEVFTNLEKVGKRHKDVEGFKAEYLDCFVVAMEDVWEEELGKDVFDSESRRNWRKIFNIITSGVGQGQIKAKEDADVE